MRRGGKEAGGEVATLGTHGAPRLRRRWAARIRRGGPGELARLRRSPMSIKGPLRRRGGCAMKVAGLTRGDLHGCPRCPVRSWFAGWCGTAVLVRAPLAVEKSADAVLPAGSMVAGKGRTRSRAPGRSCSWDRCVDRSQPLRGPGRECPRVKPEDAPVQSAAPIPGAGRHRSLTPPRRACGSSSWPAGISPRRSDASSRTPVPRASTG